MILTKILELRQFQERLKKLDLNGTYKAIFNPFTRRVSYGDIKLILTSESVDTAKIFVTQIKIFESYL